MPATKRRTSPAGRRGFAVLGIVLAVAAIGGNVSAQCQYEVTTIVGPGCATVATSINELGRVVGWYLQCGGSGDHEAFRWSAEHGMVTLPRPAGVSSAGASDINDAGVIVGTYTRTGVGFRAFVYQGGVFTELPPDPPGAWSMGLAINNAGHAVGYRSIGSKGDPVNPIQGFIWSQSGGFTDLGVMNGPNSSARDISDAGHVVGWTGILGAPGDEAFRSQDGELTLLGPIPQGLASWALAVNKHGTLVGGGIMDPDKVPDVQSQPALWKDGSWTLLGLLPGCDAGGPRDINDAEVVVGSCTAPDNTTRAFLWSTGSMYDLNALVQSDSELVIRRAKGINNAGQIVADGANSNGLAVVFLLTPIGSPVGDINIDCQVDADDLMLLLRDFGQIGSPADLNRDGIVNVLDLIILLLSFG